MSAIVLLLESEPEKIVGRLSLTDVRRFIFDRLNTGGTKLNAQEVRNALNPGPLNDIIIELTREKLFTNVFNIPNYSETNPNDYYENPERQKNSLYSSMGDCQLVLRYFALKDQDNIRGSMKAMLDRAMNVEISKQQAEDLKIEYNERFSFLYELFKGRPFELPADDKGRVRVSAAIYDSSMVALNQLWAQRKLIKADAVGVRARMVAAMTNHKHITMLTGAGNTANAVRARINLMQKVLRPE